MDTCRSLIDDNIRFLRQGVALLGKLDDATFTRTSPPTFGSGVGAHLRHCLDHYTNFLAHLPAGRIDYDARIRDPRLETDRLFAVHKMHELISELSRLPANDRPVEIKMDCDESDETSNEWSRTTLRRELQFLVSHTVHHYALIRMTLRFQGTDADAEFGMAPSTLRYNQSKAACVR